MRGIPVSSETVVIPAIWSKMCIRDSHSSATVAAGCARVFTQVPGLEEGSLTIITVGMTAALCANYN